MMAPSHSSSSSSWRSSPPLAILSYTMASMLMTVTNKSVLSSYAPLSRMLFLVLFIQSTATCLLMEVLQIVGLASFTRPSLAQARHWISVALAMALMLYTGGKALAQLPVAVFTVCKNLTIVVIALAEQRFMGVPVTRGMATSFVMIVLSSVVSAHADLSGSGGAWFGYLWVVANCLSSAFYVLYMRSSIKHLQLKDGDTVYLNNLLTAPLFLVLSPLADPSWSLLATSPQTWSFLSATFFSGVAAVGISFASAWCLRVINSTTYSMVGALNKLPIALAGVVFLGERATVGGMVGIALGFLAGVMYAKAKVDAGKVAARKKEGLLPMSEKVRV
ncbi:UDP-galactose transporter [Catenaria anguillulae PL171]|uniref:GDP-mannose transporter n=1 Tax=Catenaria anguillulae PL171 TaxID=765915 RepID=A0A1Y2HMU9_9FUNG|nr:UDP-galactose transporter [Catenaria anguillulae PL171]